MSPLAIAVAISAVLVAAALAYLAYEIKTAADMPDEPEQDPFEAVDAAIFQFPERVA